MNKIYLTLYLIVSLAFSVSAQQAVVSGSDYPGVNGNYTLTYSNSTYKYYEKDGDSDYYFTGSNYGNWDWEFYVAGQNSTFWYGFSSDSDPATIYWNYGGYDYNTDISYSAPNIYVIETTASVTTATAESITYFDATLGGEVISEGGSSVTSRGIEWGLSDNNLSNSIVLDYGLGYFNQIVNSLTPNTTYFYRAFATNSYGTVYGDVLNFQTLVATPVVTTTTAESITYSGATLGGEVISEGGSSVTSRGIEWGLSADNLDNTFLSGSDLGSFTASIAAMNPGTIYFYRAFVTNIYGTDYGSVLNFTTLHDGFDVLVVSGGGSGGAGYGGGGGGGAVKYFIAPPVSVTTAVTVGAGGAAVQITTASTPVVGNAGESSSFGSLVATSSPSANGANSSGGGGGGGGSGGGAGGSFGTALAGTAVSGMGNNGGGTQGNGVNFSNVCGGGGGGAGAVGGDGLFGTGGTGGVGISNSISGTAVYYGGGGGGGITYNGDFAGAGGIGGGGAGSKSDVTATSGISNTGGGGGGFGSINGGVSTNYSGAGGSGVVIIRYLGSTLKATGGTITQIGGYTIHTFYSSGTFTLLCENPNSGGTIATAQSGSSPFNPAAFTNSAAASGQAGTLEYKWQSSITSSSAGFSDIASSNSETYDASVLTQTTWFKRLARVSCQNDWSGAAESNVLKVIVFNSWTGAIDTTWSDAGNWSSNTIPSSLTDVIIAATSNQPIITSDVAINSLTLNSGTILTVPSGLDLTVTNFIHNSGTLTVQNNANLIQVDNVANTGNIIVNRNSAPIVRLDHTLWSSPVTGTQTLQQFSPNTLSNRFYNYTTSSNSYTATPASSVFVAGKGFTVRAPNGQPTPMVAPFLGTAWSGTFTGIPNNGTITVALATDATNTFIYNLVGNPYPSAIDAKLLKESNLNIGTTLYFYQHTLTMNSSGLFDNGSTNYATWVYEAGNPAGGIGVGASTGNGHSPNVTPTRTIQVGQGFIVKAEGNNMTFTNSMRSGSNNTASFMKNTTFESNRLWLNLQSVSGASISNIIVGYVTGASNDIDQGYDGLSFGNTGSFLSSKIGTNDYVIQGRSLPFDSNDIVPLGFTADTAGTYSISLTNKDGIFADTQDVFLKDDLTGITHDIKASAYDFTSNAGTFDARFSLIYTNALVNNDTSFISNSVVVFKPNQWFAINTNGSIMKEVLVYDMAGRLIFQQSDINANTTVLKGLSPTNGVLLVKIVSQENEVITVKVSN